MAQAQAQVPQDLKELELSVLFTMLAQECAAISTAKEKAADIVAALVRKQTALFCTENGSVGRFTELLDGLIAVKGAKPYYDQTVKGLPVYTDLPLVVSYDKKSGKHLVRMACSNMEELEQVKEKIASLCNELATGEKPDFFAVIAAKVKADRAARANLSEKVKAYEKADVFTAWLGKNIKHKPEDMEALKALIKKIIG